MNIENNLTKNAIRTYFTAGRKGFSSSSIDFSSLSSMYAWPIPVWVVVYGSLIVGVFIGMIVGISVRFAQRKKLKELHKVNRDLKAKVAEAPDEKSVVESVADEKETPQEETEEVKYEPEAKKEEQEEEKKEEEQEEQKEEEKETRF
jgi:flagellar biosynthesis GTPase FlhF